MNPVWLPPSAVVPFVAGITGMRPDFGDCQTLGVFTNDGEMVAGIIFHNYEPDAGVIEISGASTTPRWATKNILRVIFGYCFDDAGCQMVVTRYDPENLRLRRLWKAFGATEYVIPRLRGRDKSEVIGTLPDNVWAQSKFMRQ